jgi:hypothetical protein
VPLSSECYEVLELTEQHDLFDHASQVTEAARALCHLRERDLNPTTRPPLASRLEVPRAYYVLYRRMEVSSVFAGAPAASFADARDDLQSEGVSDS